MDFAQDDVMTLLYSQRQLIVVDNDETVKAVRGVESKVRSNATLDAAAAAAQRALLMTLPGGVIVQAGLELLKDRTRSDPTSPTPPREAPSLPFLVVTTSQAVNLRFPHGHPLKNVVYVADPGVAGNYYPVASFHRILFEGKVAEALRLLRSLGATEISIE
jgi:hypothetical protein